MKRLKRLQSLFLAIALISTAIAMPVFAFTSTDVKKYVEFDKNSGNISVNGKTFKNTDNNSDIVIKGHPNGNFTLTEGKYDEFKEAIEGAKEKASEKSGSGKIAQLDLEDVAAKANVEIDDISAGMQAMAPSFADGLAFFGEGEDNMIQKIFQTLMSIIVFVAWSLYFLSLLYNGAVVAIPGAYDFITGGSSGGNMGFSSGYGQSSKSTSFLAKALSKNTHSVCKQTGGASMMNPGGGQGSDEAPLKLWFKKEIVGIILFTIVTVCLFNGLVFKLISAVSKFLNL